MLILDMAEEQRDVPKALLCIIWNSSPFFAIPSKMTGTLFGPSDLHQIGGYPVLSGFAELHIMR